MVKPHSAVRSTCKHCGKNHSADVHRFHKIHAMCKSHPKYRKKHPDRCRIKKKKS